MAYNSRKGVQKQGDIHFEGDPEETQIDFEDDSIKLKTGGSYRLEVNNNHVSASGNVSGSSFTGDLYGVLYPTITAGTDNTVVVYNGTTLLTDEIDPRVWGTTLVDVTATPAAKEIAIFNDGDTILGREGLTYDHNTAPYPILALTGTLSASVAISASHVTAAEVHATSISASTELISAGNVTIANNAYLGNSILNDRVSVSASFYTDGARYRKYANKTSNYTLTAEDDIVYIGSDGAATTASLPDATTVSGIVYTIKNSNTQPMVIAANGAQTIDGFNSITSSLGQSFTIAANGDFEQL